MQGDPDVLKLLNEQLTSELTAINQYFLHSKMQANWGFTELAEHTRKESFEEMQHAEAITDRILLSRWPAELSAAILPAGRPEPSANNSKPTSQSSTK